MAGRGSAAIRTAAASPRAERLKRAASVREAAGQVPAALSGGLGLAYRTRQRDDDRKGDDRRHKTPPAGLNSGHRHSRTIRASFL